MVWDYSERRKRERNYRVMFKTALALTAFGLGLAALGFVRLVAAGEAHWLALGVLTVVWSSGSAYLTLDSTVRIIEQDFAEEWGGR